MAVNISEEELRWRIVKAAHDVAAPTATMAPSTAAATSAPAARRARGVTKLAPTVQHGVHGERVQGATLVDLPEVPRQGARVAAARQPHPQRDSGGAPAAIGGGGTVHAVRVAAERERRPLPSPLRQTFSRQFGLKADVARRDVSFLRDVRRPALDSPPRKAHATGAAGPAVSPSSRRHAAKAPPPLPNPTDGGRSHRQGMPPHEPPRAPERAERAAPAVPQSKIPRSDRIRKRHAVRPPTTPLAAVEAEAKAAAVDDTKGAMARLVVPPASVRVPPKGRRRGGGRRRRGWPRGRSQLGDSSDGGGSLSDSSGSWRSSSSSSSSSSEDEGERAGEAPLLWDRDARRWVVSVFPTLHPSGRAQVAHLSAWLDSKAAKGGRRNQQLREREAELAAREAQTKQQLLEGLAAHRAAQQRVVAATRARGGDVSAALAVMPGDGDIANLTGPDDPAALVRTDADVAVAEERARLVLRYRSEAQRQQRYLSIAAHEIVRQVSIECVERGHLLARIWNEHDERFSAMLHAMTPALQRLRKFAAALRETSREVRASRGFKAETEAVKAQLAAVEAQRDEARAEAAYRDQKNDIAHLLEEHGEALRVRLRQAERTLRMREEALASRTKEMENMRDGWSGMVTRLRGRVRKLEAAQTEVEAKHQEQLRKVTAAGRDRVEEALRKAGDAPGGDGDSGTVRQLMRVVELLRREVRNLRKLANVDQDGLTPADQSLAQLLSEGTVLPGAADAATQTSAVRVLEIGEEEASALSKELAAANRRRGRSKTMDAADAKLNVPDMWAKLIAKLPRRAAAAKVTWTLPKLRSTILDIYMEKVKSNEADGLIGADGADLPATVCSYFFHRYGVKKLVYLRIAEVVVSVAKHLSDKRVRFFARACGLVEPLPPSAWENFMTMMHFVKESLERLALAAGDSSSSKAGQIAKRWVTTHDGRTWIVDEAATVVARRALAFHADPSRADELVERCEVLDKANDPSIRGNVAARARAEADAAAPRKRKRKGLGEVRDVADMRKLCLDDLTELLQHEWEAHRETEAVKWRSVFAQVDDDGDGVLDIVEFEQALSLLGVRSTKSRTRLLYMEAVNASDSDFLDAEAFVELVLTRFQFLGRDEAAPRNGDGSTRPPSAAADETPMKPRSRGRGRRRSASTGTQGRRRSRAGIAAVGGASGVRTRRRSVSIDKLSKAAVDGGSGAAAALNAGGSAVTGAVVGKRRTKKNRERAERAAAALELAAESDSSNEPDSDAEDRPARSRSRSRSRARRAGGQRSPRLRTRRRSSVPRDAAASGIAVVGPDGRRVGDAAELDGAVEGAARRRTSTGSMASVGSARSVRSRGPNMAGDGGVLSGVIDTFSAGIQELVDVVDNERPDAQRAIESAHLSPAIRYVILCRMETIEERIAALRELDTISQREGVADAAAAAAAVAALPDALGEAWAAHASLQKSLQRARRHMLERALGCVRKWVQRWMQRKLGSKLALGEEIFGDTIDFTEAHGADARHVGQDTTLYPAPRRAAAAAGDGGRSRSRSSRSDSSAILRRESSDSFAEPSAAEAASNGGDAADNAPQRRRKKPALTITAPSDIDGDGPDDCGPMTGPASRRDAVRFSAPPSMRSLTLSKSSSVASSIAGSVAPSKQPSRVGSAQGPTTDAAADAQELADMLDVAEGGGGGPGEDDAGPAASRGDFHITPADVTTLPQPSPATKLAMAPGDSPMARRDSPDLLKEGLLATSPRAW